MQMKLFYSLKRHRKQSKPTTVSNNSKFNNEKNISRSRFNSPNELVQNENESVNNNENFQTNKRTSKF